MISGLLGVDAEAERSDMVVGDGHRASLWREAVIRSADLIALGLQHAWGVFAMA
jgi:hypothetical protein